MQMFQRRKTTRRWPPPKDWPKKTTCWKELINMPHFRINGFPIDTLRKGYKQARNEVNNFIKSAKKQYFIQNLKVKSNESPKNMDVDNLSSRKCCTARNIPWIRTSTIILRPIGSNLASEINAALTHWARILSTTQRYNIFSQRFQVLAMYTGFWTS